MTIRKSLREIYGILEDFEKGNLVEGLVEEEFNSQEISEIVNEALQDLSENFRGRTAHLMDLRAGCAERGYHLVDSANSEMLICYECEVWFGKEDGLCYMVKPI